MLDIASPVSMQAETQVLFEITVFANSDGKLTKRIKLGEDGSLITTPAATLANGSARRAPITNAGDLVAIIERLNHNEAIALGALRAGLPDPVKVVTKDKLNGDATVIARTEDFVRYEKGPAFALLDFDTKGKPADIVVDDFFETLVEVLPALRNVAHVVRRSTSSGLHRTDTSQTLAGSSGVHVFVLVQNGADIERFLTTLHQRCWLAGFGWFMISKAGTLLERSIIDRAVGRGERLVFEAPPILTPPLAQDAESRRPVAREGVALDTLASCPPLTADEQASLDKLVTKAKEKIQPEADKVRSAYIEERAEEMVERTGMTQEQAVQVIENQCRGVLLPDVVLEFTDKSLHGCTVGDVLDDPGRFEGKTLADPIEGSDYGKSTAKVLRRRDNGKPWINSFAHGGVTYTLQREEDEEEEAAENIAIDGDVRAPEFSEEALALSFAEANSERLRYVAKWGQWHNWDGTCWRLDETRGVFSLARALCREVAAGVNALSEQKRIASAKTRAAVISLAGEDRRLAARVEQWDRDPWLLNTPSGVVELCTGKLREHRSADYITKQAAVSPGGQCPLWKTFIREITCDDSELQRYLQRVSGYCLTGDTSEQELFFLYGTGNNGKGVFLQTLAGIVGDPVLRAGESVWADYDVQQDASGRKIPFYAPRRRTRFRIL
jgi:D5 N terminal like